MPSSGCSAYPVESMAKRQADILSTFAQKGAEYRILELKEEADAIFKSFPQLKKQITFEVTLPAHLVGTKVRAKDVLPSPPERPAEPENRKVRGYMLRGAKTSGRFAVKRKGRRKMSAEQRAAVSARMKAYWSKRRAAKSKSVVKTAKGSKKR